MVSWGNINQVGFTLTVPLHFWLLAPCLTTGDSYLKSQLIHWSVKKGHSYRKCFRRISSLFRSDELMTIDGFWPLPQPHWAPESCAQCGKGMWDTDQLEPWGLRYLGSCSADNFPSFVIQEDLLWLPNNYADNAASFSICSHFCSHY